MKIVISRESLGGALARVKWAVGGRSALPILACVLLEVVAADKGRVIGHNLDMGIEVELAMAPEGNAVGSCAVSHKLLSAVVGRMQGQLLTLELDKGKLVVRDDAGDLARLAVLDGGEFPRLERVAGKAIEVVVPAEVLGRGLRRTLPFASTDATRYVLNGVLVFLEEKGVQFVSTDGRRLAKAFEKLDLTLEGERDGGRIFILPRDLGRVLVAECGGLELPVVVELGESIFSARVNGCRVSGKLIEGNYPNWEQVIPGKDLDGWTVVLERAELSDALGLCQAVPGDCVRLSGQSKKALLVQAQSPDVGEVEVELAGEVLGKDVRIGFNPGFLREMVSVIEGEEVRMRMADEASPMVMEEKAEGREWLGVLMPMRLA